MLQKMHLIAKMLLCKNLYTFGFILKTKNSYEENIVLTFIGGMAYMVMANELVIKNMQQSVELSKQRLREESLIRKIIHL